MITRKSMIFLTVWTNRYLIQFSSDDDYEYEYEYSGLKNIHHQILVSFSNFSCNQQTLLIMFMSRIIRKVMTQGGLCLSKAFSPKYFEDNYSPINIHLLRLLKFFFSKLCPSSGSNITSQCDNTPTYPRYWKVSSQPAIIILKPKPVSISGARLQ